MLTAKQQRSYDGTGTKLLRRRRRKREYHRVSECTESTEIKKGLEKKKELFCKLHIFNPL